MGFDVVGTAYGRPATQLLAGQITELKAGDPLARVTVLVPSNYAATSIRRALAARPGGIAAVDFLTLHRLAERLAGPILAGAGRRPVSPPVLAQAVRTVLADDPGVFAPVADHPATELALVTATRELSGVSREALDAVAGCSGRASDVVRIARRVRRDLSPNYHDHHDLLLAATDVATVMPPIVVHLLQDLPPAGARLLGALARVQTVRVNVGFTGDAEADRAVLDAHARAGIAVVTTVAMPRAKLVIEVSDPDEEVRATVRLITQWMRAGVRLGRTGVFYATSDPYARLVHEQLDAAGIDHNGSPVLDIGELLLGRTLRSLLALPERRFRRSDVLAVLTGAPIGVPSRRWEQLSRAAGVVQGTDWDIRLGAYAQEQRERVAHVDPTDGDWLIRRLERDAASADELAAFVAKLRADLIPPDGGWAELSTWARGLVATYLGDERHRSRWPEQEREAAERVDAALERLGHLDAVGGPAPTLDVFRRTLDGELDVALRRVGRFGDGVLVGHVSMAIGLELDRVVILGMAEGAFPARRLEDSLLLDDERRAGNGELQPRSERLHDDHRQLLAAIASADEATLCFPRGDLRRHGDRYPSRWLTSVSEDADVVEVASFASGLMRAPFPSTGQEHRLATMAGGVQPVLAADRVLADGFALALARLSPQFTRYDGNLSSIGELLAEGVLPSRVSPSSLQAYAKCPYQWFGRYLLGVNPVEEPGRALEMDPAERGSLVHGILEAFITEMIAAGRGAPWTGAERDRLLQIAADRFEPYQARGATGRAMFWRRDRNRILADLERFVLEDRGTPLATEFSFDGVAYPLAGGRSVPTRGSIDRVDRAEDGSLVVIDYKTGGRNGYDGLTADDPHQRGRHLQLAMYGIAAAGEYGEPRVRSEYWFTSAKGGWSRIGYEITDAVRDEVGLAIAAIVDGITGGLFPMVPSADPAYHYNDCWYCSPDDQGAAELRRSWEHKHRDPVLEVFGRLAEPEVWDDRAD